MKNAEYIVFFDGICSLCNRFVDFLSKRDKKEQLKYSSLQGKTALTKVPDELREQLKTIVFYKNGELLYESDAAIEIISVLGGIWKLSLILKVFPKFIRNPIYRVIARNRYKWFGKRDTCRMPTPNERLKILP